MTRTPEALLGAYERAESRLEWHVARGVRNVDISPEWLDDDRFRYQDEDPDGTKRWVVVDAPTGTPRDARPDEIPELASTPPGRLVLPGGGELEERDGNLHLLLASGERQLTSDGEARYGYGVVPDTALVKLAMQQAGTPLPPAAVPAPDGTRLLTHRLDVRGVTELPLVQSVPRDGRHRPVLHTLRVPLPGDEVLPTAELVIIDLVTGEQTPISGPPLLVPFFSPVELGWVWWSSDGSRIWFLREARGASALALCEADATTGEVRTVLEEHDERYVEPSPLLPWPSQVRVLEATGEVIWRSDRTGWSHLDLHDLESGERRRAVTSGAWEVTDLVAVDERRRWVYVLAGGREGGDPYLRHLYRAHLDREAIERVTPEGERDHQVWVSPSADWVVDVASTLDTAPVVTVRSTQTSSPDAVEHELLTADLAGLTSTGWQPPERFRVLARDGRTELWGALFLPSDFDPTSSYPVVDHIYPGPQLKRTPTWFTLDTSSSPSRWPGAWHAQAIAELGFAVMTIDGPGTPLRGRSFHLHSYGDLQDGGGIDDHVAAMEQLAGSRSWLDPSRVGIVGHSAGGYAAARAILTRPDVFSVAVAASGVHDLRRYLAYWGEKYQGLEASLADDQANVTLAANLEGRLLLLHGDLDDNVHPSATLALVDALVAADKDFELVLLPNQPHACYDHPHYIRRVWDFLVRHLRGETPPSFHVRGRDEVS